MLRPLQLDYKSSKMMSLTRHPELDSGSPEMLKRVQHDVVLTKPELLRLTISRSTSTILTFKLNTAILEHMSQLQIVYFILQIGLPRRYH